MKTLPNSILALLAISLSSCNSTFNRVDADDSSRISSDEFVTHVQRSAFDQIDTDGNAFLDSDEWKVAETANEPRKRFQRLDGNRDKQLSYKEFASDPRKKRTLKRIFGTLDHNEDDRLTAEELNGPGDAP